MAFEHVLSQPDQKPKRWRRVMLTLSLALHAGALLIGVIHSWWEVEELSLPAVQVTLTAELPPPPPPPPPPRRRSSATKTRTQPIHTKNEIVQPKETPREEPKQEPEADEDDGQEGGQEGGVVGGVAGGVVGGVVGAPPPPPPKDTAPQMVAPQIGSRQLAIDPNLPQYKVKVPPALQRGGARFTALLQVCVSAQGQVTSVRILRGAAPPIDAQIPSVLGRWRYRPFLVNGRATPFCYRLRYEIS